MKEQINSNFVWWYNKLIHLSDLGRILLCSLAMSHRPRTVETTNSWQVMAGSRTLMTLTRTDGVNTSCINGSYGELLENVTKMRQ